MHMNISILTVFESLYDPFLKTSLVARAQEKGIVSFDVQSLFSYVQPKERIDAPTFGPGPGMLIRPTVVQHAIEDKEAQYGRSYKIFFSPQGQKLDQKVFETIAAKLQKTKHVMLFPARYEGMDARVEEHYADMIISLGDFVLLGGDLPVMVTIEGVIRLLSGVVGKQESIEKESFSGAFVDFPSYTEPVEWEGERVPDVLRSGNHALIEQWRHDQAVKKTVLEHFTWLRSQTLSVNDKKDAYAVMPRHYVALMHSDVLIGEKKEPGTTSVTSLDIHDIARSCKTYGVENFFLVTPLVDQQKIVKKLLDFWLVGVGIDYNRSRYEAIKHVALADDLDHVIALIEEKEGKKPILIATSARTTGANCISFFDQKEVWAAGRPVLIVLGTGKGLKQELIDRCDYLLIPICGFTEFKHLSVRSAAAIIFDRWMGINPQKVG